MWLTIRVNKLLLFIYLGQRLFAYGIVFEVTQGDENE